MNILIRVKNKYLKQINILLNSIQYSNADEVFDVYLIHQNLSVDEKNIIEKKVNKKIIKFHYTKVDKKSIEEFKKYKKNSSKDIYYGIFMSKYLPKKLDRILYLDPCTVVINKLNSLYDMDFENNYYIATTYMRNVFKDKKKIKILNKDEFPEVNTEVLLINLNLIRSYNVEERLTKKIRMSVKLLQKLDITKFFKKDKVKLVAPLKYNLGDRELNLYNLNHYRKQIGLKWIYKNTCIIKFNDRKHLPWKKDYSGKLGTFYYKIERKINNEGKVLILSCGTGGGHNSAAQAVQEAMINQGIDADFMEYLDIVNSGVRDKVNNMYLKTTVKEGKTFKVVYKLGELYEKTHLKSPVYGLNSLNSEKLYKYIEDNGYQYIVTTHLFAAQALTAIKKEHHINFIAIATDYVCIPFWKETNPDFFIIPHESLRENFVKNGVKNTKILSLGIPVKPTFSEKYDKNKCRKQLNLDKNKKYVLILTGSMGFGNVKEMVKRLDQEIPNINIIIACGNNNALKNSIEETLNIMPIGFTDSIDLYIKSADVVLSKPGGLTTTEIAVVEKPFIHTMPIPGCETHNANFFNDNNMAIKSETIEEVVENTKLLLLNDKKQKELMESQRKNINKFASKDIAELVKRQIEKRNEKWKI